MGGGFGWVGKVGVDLDVDLDTDLHMDLVYFQHAC